jgi:hypothetical protein
VEQKINELASKFMLYPVFPQPGTLEIICFVRQYIDENLTSDEILVSKKDEFDLIGKLLGTDVDFSKIQQFTEYLLPEVVDIVEIYESNKLYTDADFEDQKHTLDYGLPYKQLGRKRTEF